MIPLRWPTGTDLAIALAAFLLGWYVVGGLLNRRRYILLARQVRDSIQAFGGTASIRQIGRNAFRIEVEKLSAPFEKLSLSALLEPRETFFLWLVGRLGGRRDWLLVRATLRGSVGSQFEVYRPRMRGSSDIVRDLRSRGWQVEPMVSRPGMLYAAPGAAGRGLADRVMSELGRLELWRVGLRLEAPQLTIGFPVLPSEKGKTLPAIAALPTIARIVLAPSGKS
jgi:hypothetical protein